MRCCPRLLSILSLLYFSHIATLNKTSRFHQALLDQTYYNECILVDQEFLVDSAESIVQSITGKPTVNALSYKITIVLHHLLSKAANVDCLNFSDELEKPFKFQKVLSSLCSKASLYNYFASIDNKV